MKTVEKYGSSGIGGFNARTTESLERKMGRCKSESTAKKKSKVLCEKVKRSLR